MADHPRKLQVIHHRLMNVTAFLTRNTHFLWYTVLPTTQEWYVTVHTVIPTALLGVSGARRGTAYHILKLRHPETKADSKTSDKYDSCPYRAAHVGSQVVS